MGKINFAVWNIDGAKLSGRECYSTLDRRVNNFLKKYKKDLDFVFFQEIPDPVCLPESALTSEGWISCRADKNEEGAKCGILLHKTNRNGNLSFEMLAPGPYDFPIGAVYLIKDKYGDEIVKFVGFWNVTKKKASRPGLKTKSKYTGQLLNFLDWSARDSNQKRRDFILAGDTNVNVRTQNEERGKWTADGVFLHNYLINKKLSLIDDDKLDDYTHRWNGNKGWYRCDLLIASDSLKKNLCDFSLDIPDGTTRDAHLTELGSDHLPLFFSYSYDD